MPISGTGGNAASLVRIRFLKHSRHGPQAQALAYVGANSLDLPNASPALHCILSWLATRLAA